MSSATRQAAIDRGGRGAPILVQLERRGPRLDHLDQRGGARRIALARKGQVHRKGVRRLHHPPQVPGPRGAGGGQRAMRGAGAAAQHRGQAGMQRILDLLRADEMDVAVKAPRRQDAPLARDGLGARTDDDVHAGLRVGVARLADGMDAPVAQADIGLVDAGMIHDQRIGDDGVDRALGPRALRLAHAVADHLAATEFHLFAVDGGVRPGAPVHGGPDVQGRQVAFDLDDQVGIGQTHPVAGGGAIHVGIGGTGNAAGHRWFLGWHDRPRLNPRPGTDDARSRYTPETPKIYTGKGQTAQIIGRPKNTPQDAVLAVAEKFRAPRVNFSDTGRYPR